MVWEANMFMLRHYRVPEMSLAEWLTTTHDSAESFVRSRGVEASEEEVKKLFGEWLATNKVVSPLYPDVIRLLTYLKQIRIPAFVISKHLESHLVRDIETHGVTRYFADIIGNPEVGTMDKAETIDVIRVAEGYNQENVCYIGDTIHDMRAAQKAHVISVAVSHGYDSKDKLFLEKPDLLVGSLGELLEHFAEVATVNI
jgi:phosphoglycolate phosphatase-like HAD superfamily hydrolase